VPRIPCSRKRLSFVQYSVPDVMKIGKITDIKNAGHSGYCHWLDAGSHAFIAHSPVSSGIPVSSDIIRYQVAEGNGR